MQRHTGIWTSTSIKLTTVHNCSISKHYTFDAMRAKKYGELRSQMTYTKSGRYRNSLLQKGWEMPFAKYLVKQRIEHLEAQLFVYKKPSSKSRYKALKASSREVKYVFGVLRFPATTFILLVNKYGVTRLDLILNFGDRYTIDDIPEEEISESCKKKLNAFIEWFWEFTSNHHRYPEILTDDFNEHEWWRYYCYGREGEFIEGRPMFRDIVAPSSLKETHFAMFDLHSNFCELGLIKLAFYGR
jgi:hypothetical protein